MKLILQNKQCEGLETLTVTVVLQIVATYILELVLPLVVNDGHYN